MNWHPYRQHNSRFSFFALAITVFCLATLSFAQNNPIPQIVGPVHPDAVAPGIGAFILSVYGANFVPGSVVNWNYQPRVTTYISGHEIQAQILARDVEKNTAGFITVTNPAPGGGESSASWAQVEVHDPVSTVTVNTPTTYGVGYWAVQAADFLHNGILDLAGDYGDFDIAIFDGSRNGTFKFGSIGYQQYLTPTTFAYGDFNNDGNLDLAVVSEVDGISMAFVLGNGKGRFSPGSLITGYDSSVFYNPTIGDFNQDGNLDLVTRGESTLATFLGNGNGTFRPYWYDFAPSYGVFQVVAGDFDNDGKLDLILNETPEIEIGGQNESGTQYWFAKGKGDGSFEDPTLIVSFVGDGTAPCTGGLYSSSPLQLSDVNGDGNLDLVFCKWSQIGVMLGNGDGTFQPPIFYTADSTGQAQYTFAVGDINSDGKPDLIVSEYSGSTSTFVVFLGNGDGTFQSPQTIYTNAYSGETGITLGDFNYDGLLDAVFQNGDGANVYLQQEQ
jgi:hypothetical protein